MGRVASADGTADASQPGVGLAAEPLAGTGGSRLSGSAYRLNVEPGERDVDRFEELVASGRAEIETDPEGAAEKFRQALELWRGPPLSDLSYEPFAQTEIARLEERRWAAFEARVEAELALGRHADLVSELEAAVARAAASRAPPRPADARPVPLRPAGRGARGLSQRRAARWSRRSAWSRARSSEPCSDAILAQDPALDAPPGPEELPAALDGGSPILAGRDRELAQLIALLADACEGRGGVVLVSGPHGIGKTRLAAELAREALRRRMAVVYTGAGTPPSDALAAIRRAEESERPTLLVLDDADDAGREVLDRAAALGGDSAAGRLLLLVLHARSGATPGVRGSGGAVARAGPARGRGHSGDRAPLPAGRGRAAPDRGARRGEPRRPACRASRGGRVGAGAGLARGRSERRPRRRWSAASCAPPRPISPATCSHSGRSTSAAGSTAARRTARRCRRSAPSSASPPSTPLTRSTSSVASGSWPSWSPGSWARPCLPWSDPRGAGSPRRCGRACCRRSRAECCPGSEGWAQALMRPGEHPLAALERVLPEGGERARARRRPVRGAVHGLP